jgi:hypothetical protein
MKFSPIQPQEPLRPYIMAFWLFESTVGIPLADRGIIVPNGSARIVLPYKNSLTVMANHTPVTSKEQDLLLAGIWDVPTTISSSARATGTIGIDLSPKGLYHFFSRTTRPRLTRCSSRSISATFASHKCYSGKENIMNLTYICQQEGKP